jgi:hypothetical protein
MRAIVSTFRKVSTKPDQAHWTLSIPQVLAISPFVFNGIFIGLITCISASNVRTSRE